MPCRASSILAGTTGLLNGLQAIHPEEVTMRIPRIILLAAALVAVTLTAWAGEDGVVNSPKSARDKSAVAPTRKAAETEKTDQTPQPKQDAVQSPQAKTEAGRESQPEPKAVHSPTSAQPWESWGVATPAMKSEPGDKGELDHPRRGGGRGRGPGPGHGGNPPRGHRPPRGGSWRGHNNWPYRHYHGSWVFLWHFGPVIYPAPVYYPHVIRLPRNRAGVYVRHTGSDGIGSQFARAVREQLREEGLRVVYSPDDAMLELYVVSMDENPDEAGYWSAVSVSYIWYPGHKFITAQMLEVGLDQTDELAQSIAGYADDLVDKYR